MLRLITIPISHYCEKARWALEHAGIPYREERHVQAIHRIAARRAGGGLTVPVLVTPDGTLGDSADILAWVDERTATERRLFPEQADERPFLCGECFSAADLTFVALAAPVIVPPEYGVTLPQPEALTPALGTLVQRAREHPAGAYALELFAKHRTRPVATSERFHP